MRECPYCGNFFSPRRKDQVWCCEHHRRKGQDARRMQERYQRALRKDAFIMDDPWQKNDLDDMTPEDIFALGALDPLPAGYELDDFFGPMASQPKSPARILAARKKKPKMIQLSLI